eukprot:TRINITY_DN13519_c0_g1_i1.p1 TRINITY_DN13519_c0_g1~~TRINITY_DN13519_c0_g1_i1.p1  ORF type:complete len:197 (+),score=30.71 TRINITY_DN13519_c0_g1_i1:606-1196(+)
MGELGNLDNPMGGLSHPTDPWGIHEEGSSRNFRRGVSATEGTLSVFLKGNEELSEQALDDMEVIILTELHASINLPLGVQRNLSELRGTVLPQIQSMVRLGTVLSDHVVQLITLLAGQADQVGPVSQACQVGHQQRSREQGQQQQQPWQEQCHRPPQEWLYICFRFFLCFFSFFPYLEFYVFISDFFSLVQEVPDC